MRGLARRIRRLEEQFGPPIETEFSRRLRKRLESARQRIAAAGGERSELVPKQQSASEEYRLQVLTRAAMRIARGIEERNRRGRPR